jgi:hypothetical protein
MPYSSSDGKEFFTEWFKNFLSTVPGIGNPKRVLDVGAGEGAYGKIIRRVDSSCHIEAVEIFEYSGRFGLDAIYDKVYMQDIRDFMETNQDTYDLIIFGDVLEHLSKLDALRVWAGMKPRAKFLLISLPIIVPGKVWSIDYNQGPHEYQENPNEKHLYSWEYDELVNEMGPFFWRTVYQFVGMFIAEGGL